MQIKRLEVDSFLGIKRAHLDFSEINIIAGDNWSGKSSLQQALRVALAGEVARVKLKGQYGLLVKEGSKNAKITVYMDDGTVQDVLIPLTGKAQVPNCDDDVIKIALDQQRFVSMTDAERRKVIFGLTGNLFNAGKIKRRMAELGADMELAEQVLPLLNNGFEAAVAEAESKAKEFRALWKAVTGETYGSDKAETWVDMVDVEEVQLTAKGYAKFADDRNKLIHKIDEQQKKVEAVRVQYIESVLDYTCASCEYKHIHDTKISAGIKEIFEAEAVTLDFLKQSLIKIELNLNTADESAKSLKTIEAVAKDRTDTALKHHANVVAWAHIKELLSENGIMSEIVSDALQPLNKRLAHSASVNDFGQVAIHSDMSITIDNRLYGLCSEAQQWLAQAMLCEAISYIADFNIVILDRIDVLGVANRSKLIEWCTSLSNNVQFILFGTLKSRPMLDGISTFWVENGEVLS